MAEYLEGNLVDVINRKIFPAKVIISDGRILSIVPASKEYNNYILPGLIDSHVHVESSMLTPSRFAEMAVKHGTVAVVADPHEIANVAGVQGVDFMISNGSTVPLKFFFGAPSCVPATDFETSGAKIGSAGVSQMLERDEILYLSEMMNFPGVLNRDADVMQKIQHAKTFSKPVDGHAPGLRGKDLLEYIKSGISTDHECMVYEEAVEKIEAGMKIQIREGSAAKGLDTLMNLIDIYPGSVMLCTDDMHPDDLALGHINLLVKRCVESGKDLFNTLRAATVNPITHYRLPAGLLREGDPADLILVNDLRNFEISETWVDGRKAYSDGRILFRPESCKLNREFRRRTIFAGDIAVIAQSDNIRVIEAFDGMLYTKTRKEKPKLDNRFVVSDTIDDILKIVIVNRYNESRPVAAFIKGFGLKKGAIASSVAHDSHNIIAVGVTDEEITEAVNTVIEMGGGLVSLSAGRKEKLPLEVGGLMTDSRGAEVAANYRKVEDFALKLGSTLNSPFMTLSFMALLVIPELKISDRGLFDTGDFKHVPLFV